MNHTAEALVPFQSLISPSKVHEASVGLISSIQEDGLLRPLVVAAMPEGEGFRILQGTRRYLAIKALRESGSRCWDLIQVDVVASEKNFAEGA